METQPSKSTENSEVTTLPPNTATNTPVAPKSSLLRFPVRIGITWKKGERLEAQDFSNTWYPSKIVEISEEEKAVLIHFEGWNQRYDEWFLMASDRLRPTTRHSERKDKGNNKRRRSHPHPIYRPGDEVLARWKDCKKYPAKIIRLIEESTYEVIFYDGVTHLIQAMNIQPMPEEMKAAIKNIPPPPKNKFSFKQVKVNLPASVRKKQEQKPERVSQTLAGKVLAKSKRSPSKLITRAKFLPKVTLKRDRELDVYSVVGNKGPPSPPKKENPVTITCEATLSTLSEAECLKLFGSAAVGGGDAPDLNTGEPSASTDDVSIVAVEPPSTESSAGESSSSTLGTIHEGGPKHAKDKKGGKKNNGSRVRKRAYTDTSAGGAKRKKLATAAAVSTEFGIASNVQVSKKLQPPLIGCVERSKSLDNPGILGISPALPPLAPQIFIPSKAFIVEEDHNPFKCPHDGCTKDFRKENLLQYHIKYYHTEHEATSTTSSPAAVPSQPTTPAPVQTSAARLTVSSCVAVTSVTVSKPKADTHSSAAVQTASISTSTPITSSICNPKRRRRKTDSICSTDSEMSASSKSKSSKRNRNDSEISVTTESPEVAGRETQTDSSRLVQELAAEEESLIWPDTEEAEEEEMASDVVNCVCGERHHTGLMIQCEVCMCWQHFKCADVNKTGVPPVNYVCLICEKSPGTRDSCRYLHDMGWERRGELPTFPFTQPKCASSNPPPSRSSTSHLTTLASECNDLLATLHGVKSALHSTRRQIKISKEEDDPEFQLWQTDWDNWIKPQEVLALTPRSGDPDLSPTPSTFLFPPATATHHQGHDLEKKSGDSEFNKAANLGSTSGLLQATEGEDRDSSLHSPTKIQSATVNSISSSSSSILPHSSSIEGDVSAMSPSSNIKLPEHTFSSQLFSVSSTPPKVSASQSLTNAVPTGMSSLKLEDADDFSTSGKLLQQGPPTESQDISNEAFSKSNTDFPLAINTSQALSINTAQALSVNTSQALSINTAQAFSVNTSQPLSINTSQAPAQSPSSSSLSSLQLSTPPMMLSPATGPIDAPPPQTPSVGRSSSHLPTISNEPDVSGLVRDLFPGPAGDAPDQAVDKSPELLSAPQCKTTGLYETPKDTESGKDNLSLTHEGPSQTQTLNTRNCVLVSEEEENPQDSSNPQTQGPQEESSAAQRGNQTEITTSNNSDIVEDDKADTAKHDKAGSTVVRERETSQDSNHGDPSSPPSPSPHHDWDRDADHPNGSLSPHTASSFYLGVNGKAGCGTAFSFEDDEDTQDNDTDTAEESADPYKNCEHNLLVHVQKVHTDIEQQLEGLEARILELENSEHNNPSIQLSEENILNDIPALKKSLSKLAQHLMKVHHFTS